MYQAKRRISVFITNVILIAFFTFTVISVIPALRRNSPKNSPLATLVTIGIAFGIVTVTSRIAAVYLTKKAAESSLEEGETEILSNFIEKLRFCYSLDEFNEIVSQVLEIEGDCSVLYIDRAQNYILYNSPDRLTCSKDITDKLERNYSKEWKDGLYFLGENYGVVTSSKKARGFLLVHNKQHLYVFCRYTKLFDHYIFKSLYEEYCRFQSRIKTIAQLSEISSLSKDWNQLAETQRSFLPPSMPFIDKLSIAAYYKPLVNVSGDYYTVLPISETKTLLMLGDVSGKGLAAALVMGLVMNTVKNIANKENLSGVIQAVDKAIKGMKLQDKYTVVFIGIVDTERMVIRYVNASMSDPVVISKSPTGYKLKPLTSNCSLVGIIDLPDIEPSELKLFRGDVILMASDGVSEVMDKDGVELGTTQLYQDTIKASAAKKPEEFIKDVVDLIHSYNGGAKLRDDLTMMVAKVER